ncbi:MAG: hypothetical protein N2651_00960, partial [Fimbriimonadales bacterium]|nr:hypothetical protein [Fimbriimonadales bacterium]
MVEPTLVRDAETFRRLIDARRRTLLRRWRECLLKPTAFQPRASGADVLQGDRVVGSIHYDIQSLRRTLMMGVSLYDADAPAETVPVFCRAGEGVAVYTFSEVQDAYCPLVVMARLKPQPSQTVTGAELLRMPYAVSLEETLLFGELYPTWNEIIVPF